MLNIQSLIRNRILMSSKNPIYVIGLFLLFQSYLFSTTYYVDGSVTGGSCTQADPCEFIQTAIDHATTDGDIVIVAGGMTYDENLLIETGITLKSESSTNPATIDGSNTDGGSNGSCIIIRSPSGSTTRITSTVEDLIITGGLGTVVNEDVDHNGLFGGTIDEQKKVGGGILVHNANFTSRRNRIVSNGNLGTKEGGAVYVAGSGIEIEDDNPQLPPPLAFDTRSTIIFDESEFLGNYAQIGHTMMANGWNSGGPSFNLSFPGSTFDVAFDTDNNEEDGIAEYWVIGKNGSNFDFSGGISGQFQALDYSVWVDPILGNDEDNIVGDISHPFKSINYALSMVFPTEENPITIYLDEGTYSPSTNGESFPIEMIANVNFIGQGEELTILDAEFTSRVINIDNVENISLSHLMILSGNAEGYYWYEKYGGGIYINNSSPIIEYVNFVENTSENAGGGIYLYNSTGSYRNLHFTNNSGTHGGGIHIQESPGNSVTIFDSLFVDNNIARVGNGGGIDINYSSSATDNQPIVKVQNSIITNNFCEGSGGGIRAGQIGTNFDNIEVKNNVSDDGGGGIFYSGNSGGPRYLKNSFISNNTCGGNNEDVGGGGILIVGTQSLSITNTIITENSATYMDWGSLVGSNGGGIYIKYYTDNLVLQNVEITNNLAKDGSAIYKSYDCHGPDLINVTISGNTCLQPQNEWNEDGYAIYLTGDWSPTNIVNSIIDNGDQNVIYGYFWNGGNQLNLVYSTIYSGIDGIIIVNGNMFFEQLYEFNPEFTDTENGDYTLSENSPCINAGTDYYIIDGDTLINLPSNDYFGQAPDLGAYESEYDIGLLPEIEMSIDSIYVTLEPNSIETMNLIIENIGEGPLSFETDLIYSKINYALEFNTGDYIDIEDEELFDISNFTFEVWINVDETNGWRTIIDIDNDEQVLGIHNGQYAIYGRCGNNSLGSVQSDWNHLAWTVSGENYFVFLNGIEIGSGLGCSSFVDADHLMIGSGYGGNEYFSGSIDDVRIWNRALTQEEILLNMNQTLYQEDGDGLIGYWVFDEGSGNTTLDYSGNGNNGTIVGAEWVESSMINFPWLTIEPSNGIIIPGDNIIVSIIFDTQNLVPDIYFADLILNTNDIDELQIIIPITLDIIEEFIYGCTNPESINYNPNAIIDDGSCEYCILGDVNGDDSINILDIVIMVDAILGNGTEYNDCMDVNVDGTVNILDIVILVDIILNP